MWEYGPHDASMLAHDAEGRQDPAVAPLGLVNDAPHSGVAGVSADIVPYESNMSAGGIWNNLGGTGADVALPAFRRHPVRI
jgi:hypothetical protein